MDTIEKQGNKSSNRRGPCPGSTFPSKLHMILSNPDYSNEISWMPHGRSWRVLDPKLFEEKVMPKYFAHQSKYSSFTRQVNGWGFKRITHGPDRNSYYHEFFIRDFPEQARKMSRRSNSSNAKTSNKPAPSSVQANEPNFYEMSGISYTPPVSGSTSLTSHPYHYQHSTHYNIHNSLSNPYYSSNSYHPYGYYPQYPNYPNTPMPPPHDAHANSQTDHYYNNYYQHGHKGEELGNLNYTQPNNSTQMGNFPFTSDPRDAWETHYQNSSTSSLHHYDNDSRHSLSRQHTMVDGNNQYLNDSGTRTESSHPYGMSGYDEMYSKPNPQSLQIRDEESYSGNIFEPNSIHPYQRSRSRTKEDILEDNDWLDHKKK